MLREYIDAKQCFSSDDLVYLSNRIKAFAQVFDQILLRDSVFSIRRHDGTERLLRLFLTFSAN